MNDQDPRRCVECVPSEMNRRAFIKAVGAGSALLAAETLAPRVWAGPQPAPANHVAAPAETLIQELHASLTPQQRPDVVFPWNHVADNNATPVRLRMYNAPIGRPLGDVYTPAQQELLERIFRAIASDEEGYRKLSRNGTWDNARGFQGVGATIFGDPAERRQFSLVFAGHHITIRCDGNSEPGAGFGGPMFYGHLADGTSVRNVYNYQTRSVLSVYDALNEQQRRRAVVAGTPGENANSVRFRNEGYPGLVASDLTADQRRLVETVMRDVLSPYRREDADEVMQIVQRNGGLERIHLAFYRDAGAAENTWQFWRLEGPGFVWNYRILPHVHTYVNIAQRA